MSSGIVIPKEYAYPAVAALSTFYLLFWQTARVGRARGLAKIEYPQVYADKAEAAANRDAYIFNCKQRAHQNTLEFLPTVVTSTLIAGIHHPVAAAALCGTWTLTRVIYTLGYSTGQPSKRNSFGMAMVGTFAMLALLGTSTYDMVSVILSL